MRQIIFNLGNIFFDFDKNFLFVGGSIRNAVLYVKEILTTKCRVLL